jgi:hypothetical protein
VVNLLVVANGITILTDELRYVTAISRNRALRLKSCPMNVPEATLQVTPQCRVLVCNENLVPTRVSFVNAAALVPSRSGG